MSTLEWKRETVFEPQDQTDSKAEPELKVGRLSKTRVAVLILLPTVLFLLSLFIGRYPVSPETCVKVLLAKYLNICDLLSYDQLVFDLPAIEVMEEYLGKGK